MERSGQKFGERERSGNKRTFQMLEREQEVVERKRAKSAAQIPLTSNISLI